MSDTAMIELVAKLSALGPWTLVGLMIVAAFYYGYKQKWVWGHQLSDMKTERDFWRTQALLNTHLAERVVGKPTPDTPK